MRQGECHHWLRSGGTTREVNQTSRQENPRENNHLVSAGELLGVTCRGLDESVALVSSDLGRRMVMGENGDSGDDGFNASFS